MKRWRQFLRICKSGMQTWFCFSLGRCPLPSS